MGGQPMSDKDAEDASDMSDIVERLREMATGPVSHRPITAGRLCNEAAAEIERLRAAVATSRREALEEAATVIDRLNGSRTGWAVGAELDEAAAALRAIADQGRVT